MIVQLNAESTREAWVGLRLDNISCCTAQIEITEGLVYERWDNGDRHCIGPLDDVLLEEHTDALRPT